MACDPGSPLGNFFSLEERGGARDPDHDACRTLWIAVIYKALKDMAYADAKELQNRLTPSERDKLRRIHESDTPADFFRSNWFEEICSNLELSASRIRTEVLDRGPGAIPFRS